MVFVRPFLFRAFTVISLGVIAPAFVQAAPETRRDSTEVSAEETRTSIFDDSSAIHSIGGGVVTDPSFEAGRPNPFWEESSTNFGTPLCTVAICGSGTGTGPQDGEIWAWFGGFGGFEESRVSQEVTFPDGAIQLTFGLEVIVCDPDAGPDHFMEVLIDETQIFLVDANAALCGVLGYSEQSVDVSGWAGGTHTIEFHGIVTGPMTTNFFVDQVQVVLARVGVLAEDDFRSAGSGAGWEGGDTWDGAVADGVAEVTGGSVSRVFAAPIDTTTLDKLYLEFDMARQGDQYAGVSLFNGEVEGVFAGRPFQANQYGFDVINFGRFVGGPEVDVSTHHIVVEIDFAGGTGGDDLIRLFVDYFDPDRPDATAELPSTVLEDTLTEIRLGTDGKLVVDNLVVADRREGLAIIFADGFESGDTSGW